MSLRRHTIAFGVTALLYATAITLLWRLQPPVKSFALHPQKMQRLRVSLAAFRTPSPKPNVPQPLQVEPTLPPEPKPQPSKPKPKLPEPMPEPKPTEHPKRQPDDKPPVVKPPVTKPHPIQTAKHSKHTVKPKLRRKIHTRRKPHRAITTHKRVPKLKHKSSLSSRVSSRAASVQSAARKQAFLAALRRRIESHKYYPPIAKRRGMQGSVRVRFRILANGRLGTIQASGSRLFVRSAKEAVRAAFPVSTKHAGVRFPLDVTLTLHYHLR